MNILVKFLANMLAWALVKMLGKKVSNKEFEAGQKEIYEQNKHKTELGVNNGLNGVLHMEFFSL